MTLAAAEALAPGLVAVPIALAMEAETLRRLAAWCLRYAPLTAPDPPDGLWIESAGAAHLFGGEEPMLADMLARFTRAGFAVRGAIADTPGAAYALARYGGAKKVIAPPGGTRTALAALPPAALRLGEEAVALLTRLGITRIDTLAGMPRGPLARRLGAELLRRLDQALGRAPESITPLAPPETPAARFVFVEPLITAEALSFAITKLAEDLCRTLERRGIGARRLDLRFERIDGATEVASIATTRARSEAGYLARLLAERLPEIAPEPGVAAMRLEAALVEPLRPTQTRASFAGEDEAPDLASLIDRLANRLGAERLYRTIPIESDVPERSLARVPPLAAFSGKTWPADLPRPARLLFPPEPVRALALLPDHPPAQFVWRGERHRLIAGDGPERIFGEWWKSETETFAVRDYFSVEDESGRRYWLFRRGDGLDPATGDGGWFLHGFF